MTSVADPVPTSVADRKAARAARAIPGRDPRAMSPATRAAWAGMICQNPTGWHGHLRVKDLPRDSRVRTTLHAAVGQVARAMAADRADTAHAAALVAVWASLEATAEADRLADLEAAERAHHRDTVPVDPGADLEGPTPWAELPRARSTAPPDRPVTTAPHAPHAPPHPGRCWHLYAGGTA